MSGGEYIITDAVRSRMRTSKALFDAIRDYAKDDTIGGKLAELGRVTDAEFEVIEPNTSNDDRRDESAGDGTTTGGVEWQPIGGSRSGQGTYIAADATKPDGGLYT